MISVLKTQSIYRAKLAKYVAIVRINMSARIETTAELIGQIPLIIVRLVLLHALYTTTYMLAGAESFGNLTVQTIIWQLMLITPFESALYPTISTLINEEITTGSIAYTLTKPYSYLLHQYAAFVGRAIPVVFITFLTGCVTTWWLVGWCASSFFAFTCGIGLLIIGCTIDFLIEANLGLLAFWLEDTTSLSFIYRQAILILGGFLIPISLYPQALQKIAHALPFSSLFYEPAVLIVNFNGDAALSVLYIQLVWLISLTLLATLLFHKGMKHVSVAGG